MNTTQSRCGMGLVARTLSMGFAAMSSGLLATDSLGQVWTGAGDDQWANPSNWNPAVPPPVWGVVSLFGTNNTSINLGTTQFVSHLLFDSSSAYTLHSGALQVLASVQTAGDIETGVLHRIQTPVFMANAAPVQWHIEADAPLRVEGEISGAFGLLKTGSGELTLGADNTYTGTTTISDGTLRIGLGSIATGSTGSVAGPIVNNAKLVFQHHSDHTHSGDISGTGELIKTGLGALNLTGSNNVGTTNLELGTLNISSGGLLDSGTTLLGTNYPNAAFASVSGPGSRWKTQGTLTVGHVAPVVLEVRDGGDLVSDVGLLGEFHAATTTVRVTGAGSRWENAQNITVGKDGDATLEVLDGGVVTSGSGVIGVLAGSESKALIGGADSFWALNGNLTVGQEGVGRLQIENGAAVSNHFGRIGEQAGSGGHVTVTGADSTWTNSDNLYVGYSGIGELIIEDGGRVGSSSGFIGFGGDSDSQVTVTGAGSTWTNSSLNVGGGGTGKLLIEAGGSVSNIYGSIGFGGDSDGQVTVSGAGSTWANSQWLSVGQYGTGELSIEAGGSVDNTDGYIGLWGGSDGQVTVTGVGSTWSNRGILYVGRWGAGELLIESGGSVSNGFGYIGREAGSDGQVTVTGAGSTWTHSGELSVGSSGTATGALTIDDGGTVDVATSVKVWDTAVVALKGGRLEATTIEHTHGGTFDFTGGVLAVDTFRGRLDQQGGILAPGNSLGTTHITGDYNLMGGGVEIEWEGDGDVAGVHFDQLLVDGDANLDGVLQLVSGDYVFEYGDLFHILEAGQVEGAFTLIEGVNVQADLALAVTYTETQVNVTAALPGDANLDGQVSLLDLDILGRSYGQAGTWSQGDFNGDGQVTLLDLDTLGRYYGQGHSAFLADWQTLNIPEPTGVLILSLGVVLASRRRRA